MLLSPTGFRLLENPRAACTAPYRANGRDEILSLSALAEAKREITSWPGYRPTPLRRLTRLAAAAGIGEILYKDEAERFGIGSFKALGGAYAVFRVLQEEIHRQAAGTTVSVPRPVVRPLRRRDLAHHRDRRHRRQPWPLRRVGCAQFRLPVRHLPAGKHQRRTLSRDRRLRRASQARAGDLRRCGEARGRRCRGATLARRFRYGVRGLHRRPAPRDAGLRADGRGGAGAGAVRGLPPMCSCRPGSADWRLPCAPTCGSASAPIGRVSSSSSRIRPTASIAVPNAADRRRRKARSTP